VIWEVVVTFKNLLRKWREEAAMTSEKAAARDRKYASCWVLQSLSHEPCRHLSPPLAEMFQDHKEVKKEEYISTSSARALRQEKNYK